MSEPRYMSYGKLELLPEPGDKFRLLIDGKEVRRGIRRKDVPKAIAEELEKYE